jgi:predicted RNA-binding Zn-ribbon protein involved in translation (DUF1610 family)
VHPGEKVCPQCGDVYRPGVERCADCGVALVHPEELTGDAGPELPPATELVAIRIAGIAWLRAFSDALSEAGVPHRIDSPPESVENASLQRRAHDQGLAVYVRPQDRERALAADAAFVRSQLPDLEGELQGEAPASESEDCPACGAHLDERATECPDCGLFVGEGE